MDTSELLIEAVWDDPDAIQVRASVRFGPWAGGALAYATRAQLTAFAAALDGVAAGVASAAVAVGQRELGSADVRLYEYGRARRLGVVVRLQEPADAQRAGPAADSALQLAAPLERGALPGFAAGLRAIARDGGGASTLALLPRLAVSVPPPNVALQLSGMQGRISAALGPVSPRHPRSLTARS